MKRLLLGALVLAVTVTGCAPDRGTVTRTWSSYSTQTKQWTYTLCARDDHGKEGCGQVGATAYLSCHSGDRWPDCQSWRHH